MGREQGMTGAKWHDLTHIKEGDLPAILEHRRDLGGRSGDLWHNPSSPSHTFTYVIESTPASQRKMASRRHGARYWWPRGYRLRYRGPGSDCRCSCYERGAESCCWSRPPGYGCRHGRCDGYRPGGWSGDRPDPASAAVARSPHPCTWRGPHRP